MAEVTLRLYGDKRLSDMVEIALGEAMTNIISHAYDDVPGDAIASLPGRWWFAGVADRTRGEALFYAYDLGVGIPIRAPQSMNSALQEYWQIANDRLTRDRPIRDDAQILEAAVRARRLGIGQERAGNGLPAMIDLIDQESSEGAIQITSGRARYRFEKRVDRSGTPFVKETCARMREPLMGTLVVWRVRGPSIADREAD